MNTRKVWFFSYIHRTLHQVHWHHCTLTCLSFNTHSWNGDTADMSNVTHIWTYTKAHHIQAQLCMTSAAHPQDDLWNPTAARAPPVQQEYPPQVTHILFVPMQLVQLCFIPAQFGLQIQHLGLGCPLSRDCSFSSLFHLHRTTLLKGGLWKNVFSLPIAHKSPLKFNWHILIHKQQLSLVLFSVANWIQFFNSADKQHQHITCISLNTMIIIGLRSWEGYFQHSRCSPFTAWVSLGEFTNMRNDSLVFWHPQWPSPADVPGSCTHGSSPPAAADTGGSTPHVLLWPEGILCSGHSWSLVF